MKRVFSLFLVTVVFISLISSPALCVSAKDVLAKMIKAQGGKESLLSIKDSTVSGTFELVQQGLTGTLTIYKKEPNMRRSDFEVMGMLFSRAYDGEMAWWVNPQTMVTEEMPEQDAVGEKRNAMPSVSILDPEKYGLSFVLKENESIDGKEYIVLEQTYPDGLKVKLYVDPETHLTHRTNAVVDTQIGEVEVVQVYSDYKKVNGRTMAHSIVSYQDGMEYMKIFIDEVKFNTGLETPFFKMEK